MKLIVLYFFLDIIHLASLSGNSSVFHNCTFSPWTSYDSCSATCGGGFKTRRKFILNDENRDTCWKLANKTQIIPCAVLPCPIDCRLNQWTKWTRCSCFTGFQTRSRKIIQRPLFNGHPCQHILETKECFSQCQTGCKVVSWSQWTSCDQSCGKGNSYRTANFSSPFLDECNSTNDRRQCFLKACKGHHDTLTDLAQFAAFMTFSVCLFMCVLILIRIAVGEGVC